MLKENESILTLDQALAALVISAEAYVKAKNEGAADKSDCWIEMHSRAKSILEAYGDRAGLEENIRGQLNPILAAPIIDSFFKHLKPRQNSSQLGLTREA